MNRITINGRTITCNGNGTYIGNVGNMSIINGRIIVDGKEITKLESNSNTIIIEGDCGNIEADGSVEVRGNCKNIDCGGSVNCKDVSGHVNCGCSVNCGNVDGDVSCGGSLSMKR